MNKENFPHAFLDCLGPESKIFILMALGLLDGTLRVRIGRLGHPKLETSLASKTFLKVMLKIFNIQYSILPKTFRKDSKSCSFCIDCFFATACTS